MNQYDVIVAADNIAGVDGSVPAVVNDRWSQGVVALAAAVVLNIRKRRNIKWTDLCIGSLAAAVDVMGGEYRTTQQGILVVSKQLGHLGMGVLDAGAGGAVQICWRGSIGGKGALLPVFLPIRSPTVIVVMRPTVTFVSGCGVVMASTCGKLLINGVVTLFSISVDA